MRESRTTANSSGKVGKELENDFSMFQFVFSRPPVLVSLVSHLRRAGAERILGESKHCVRVVDVAATVCLLVLVVCILSVFLVFSPRGLSMETIIEDKRTHTLTLDGRPFLFCVGLVLSLTS